MTTRTTPMEPALERLVSSLLYEGYALYPYTPGATKNATPTPFGIVYPPAYAARNPAAFDHLRIECIVRFESDATLSAAVRFLQATGSHHEATERAVGLDPRPVRDLAREPGSAAFGFEDLTGRVVLDATVVEEGIARVRVRVENTTAIPAAELDRMDRPAALVRSLLSTHVVARVTEGRFVSPLAREGRLGELVRGCESVNSWPVLATPVEDAVLGAAIILPDHPRIAPRSRGNLFDGTEIEEALLLHVHALSEGERQAIDSGDPTVREMVGRAAATTADDLMDLHARFEPARAGPPGFDPQGEEEARVGEVVFRRGDKVVLRPGVDGNPHDSMLEGRRATIERIYLDYDDRVHLGVTVDEDPGQELFRETGRYLFFFGHEVERVSA